MSDKPITKLGFCDDEPQQLPDGRTVRAKSSSRAVMILTGVLVVGTWSAINVINVVRAKPATDGAWVPVDVKDFPVYAALLVIGVMFAKDKPIDKLLEIVRTLRQ